MKQLTPVTLGAHYKIKSKLSTANEPPFLVKHKALTSSRDMNNIPTFQGKNDEKGKTKKMDL